jgi:hypothetical protein
MTLTHPEGVQRGFAPLQVQDGVLRFFAFASVIAGALPLHPTRGHSPLDPLFTRVWRASLLFMTLTHPEGVQRGFAPLQVQDGVLRFFAFASVIAGVSPLHPTRGHSPLDPFFTRVWRAFVMFITLLLTHPEGVQRGFAPLQVQDGVLRFFAFASVIAGVSPLHPTRGHSPLFQG